MRGGIFGWFETPLGTDGFRLDKMCRTSTESASEALLWVLWSHTIAVGFFYVIESGLAVECDCVDETNFFHRGLDAIATVAALSDPPSPVLCAWVDRRK